MKQLDISKKRNKRCERCQYYCRTTKSKSKGVNPFGHCAYHNADFKYWHTCEKFIWKHKYIGISKSITNSNGTVICLRCHKPLTDPESIARGFGDSCYNKHLRDIIKKNKRLI